MNSRGFILMTIMVMVTIISTMVVTELNQFERLMHQIYLSQRILIVQKQLEAIKPDDLPSVVLLNSQCQNVYC